MTSSTFTMRTFTASLPPSVLAIYKRDRQHLRRRRKILDDHGARFIFRVCFKELDTLEQKKEVLAVLQGYMALQDRGAPKDELLRYRMDIQGSPHSVNATCLLSLVVVECEYKKFRDLLVQGVTIEEIEKLYHDKRYDENLQRRSEADDATRSTQASEDFCMDWETLDDDDDDDAEGVHKNCIGKTAAVAKGWFDAKRRRERELEQRRKLDRALLKYCKNYLVPNLVALNEKRQDEEKRLEEEKRSFLDNFSEMSEEQINAWMTDSSTRHDDLQRHILEPGDDMWYKFKKLEELYYYNKSFLVLDREEKFNALIVSLSD